MTQTENNYTKRRYAYYWFYFIVSYVFPFAYFLAKLGITQHASKIVLPVVLLMAMGVIRLAADIPRWVATWRPCLAKGLVRAIPKVVLFITLITLGLTLKYILDNEIDVAFINYFETVLVLFGSISVGSIIEAYHLKYKELDLIAKGYVLGIVNKRV